MSRIDEALKRAERRRFGTQRRAGVDAPDRAADPVETLDDYPLEDRSAPGLVQPEQPVQVREAPVSPGRAGLGRQAKSVELGRNPKLVVSGGDGVSLEQYRRLAASLHEAQVQRGLKTIVVTSAVPGEGKTLTAANLALTFSESYSRNVLLIDADQRKPSMHELLGIPNEYGLADTLRSSQPELKPIQVAPLFAVLTAGRLDASPLAGLSSDRMRALLDEASSRFDWVILDTPPLALLSDAQLLAHLTRAVVFVIKAGSTPFPVIRKALDELGPEHVVGTVLNGVDDKAIPAAGYYGRYYGY
jgi:capsular exopolysaccharide synthesis family protein